MTTAFLIVLFAAVAIVMAAAGRWHSHKRKEVAALNIPMHILYWLVRRTARIEDKLNRLHDKIDRLMTKKDGEAILKAIKTLQDVLSKPTLNIELGKPTDQQEK